MKLIFNKKDITKYLLDFSLEYSLDRIYSTVSFSLPYKIVQEEGLSEGMEIKLNGSELKFEGICIQYSDSNNDIGKFTGVSKAWYLSVYEETYQVNASAKEAINSIVKNYDGSFNVQIDPPEFSTEIKKIYFDMNLEEIIEDIFSQVSSKSGKSYYFVDIDGTLKVLKSGKDIEISPKYILDLQRKFDISKVKNQIKVITTNDNKISTSVVVKDSQSIGKIGAIQKVHKIESKNKAQGKSEAEKLLKLYSKLKREVSISLVGDYSIKVADIAKINKKKFLIRKVKHTINNSMHITSLDMEAYDG